MGQDRRDRLRRVLACLGGTALSGVLLLVALPPIGYDLLGWFCLVPLLIGVRGTGLMGGVLSPIFACLFAAFLSTTSFIPGARLEEGSDSWNFVGFLLFSFVILVVSLPLSFVKRLTLPLVFGLAGVAIFGEAIIQYVLPAHLALMMAYRPELVALASVGGIWMISYLVWLSNLALVLAIQNRKHRRPALVVAVATVLVGLAIPWRTLLIKEAAENTVRIAVIQTQSTNLRDLAEFNREAKSQGAAIAVWPELSAIKIVDRGDTTLLRELSSEPNQVPFITTFRDDASPKPHNALAHFDQGVESERYFKRHPFGGEKHIHQRGIKPLTLKSVAPLGGANVAVAICFDSCYPSSIRASAKLDDPSILILPSLDPMSTTGFVQAVHGAFTPFRAAESGLPIVRSEITAYSQVVDRMGRVVLMLPLGFEGGLPQRCSLANPTLFT